MPGSKQSFTPSGRRLLGLDPGLTRCGVAVVDEGSRRPSANLVDVGVARSAAGAPIHERVCAIAEEVDQWLLRYRPHVVAIEQVFVQRNRSNAMGTAHIIGAVMVLAHRIGAQVMLLTPTQVKAAVTGHGGADKQQLANMVVRVCGLQRAPQPADAADAVAIALAGMWQPGHLVAGTGLALGSSGVAAQRTATATSGRATAAAEQLTAAQAMWQRSAATHRTRSWEQRIAQQQRLAPRDTRST